ncbi:hypothetical protein A4A58_13270 [Tardiphaga robiniae]|uniref:Uncharacterized protein n=1 Tax=Tardiphaga robiniae TaxID=943830 RepID=A0A163XTP4_9BRAD|nr:hypothetical protein A4A58_13270 [Tardiphaga robiniae]
MHYQNDWGQHQEVTMAMIHRPWTDDETAMLRVLAGTLPPKDIAKAIGRTRAAVTIRAHEMHLSLRRLDPDGVERNWAKVCPG